MNYEENDPIWEKLAGRLFNGRFSRDQHAFTALVMASVRELQPADLSWRIFFRWALPALTMSLASLLLAWRMPVLSAPLNTDSVIFQAQTADDDLAESTLGD
jgi:hypothetical protein